MTRRNWGPLARTLADASRAAQLAGTPGMYRFIRADTPPITIRLPGVCNGCETPVAVLTTDGEVFGDQPERVAIVDRDAAGKPSEIEHTCPEQVTT